MMFGVVRSLGRPVQALAVLMPFLVPGWMGSALAQAEQPAVETISVLMDQAKLVKLPGGADTIVIGNPAIADVTVQKNGVLVLTGRSAGRTNFIALNAAGSIISESMVTVTIPMAGRVLVQRGLEPTSYDCAPLCLPSVTLGDEDKHFSRSLDQAQRRDSRANQSATAPGRR
jgi:hypothetical protein